MLLHQFSFKKYSKNYFINTTKWGITNSWIQPKSRTSQLQCLLMGNLHLFDIAQVTYYINQTSRLCHVLMEEGVLHGRMGLTSEWAKPENKGKCLEGKQSKGLSVGTWGQTVCNYSYHSFIWKNTCLFLLIPTITLFSLVSVWLCFR